jgi:hypothetical protein
VYYVVLKNYIKSPKGVLCFMKKFFALFTIVALLAVAGSAFAANPTVTFSPSSLTVTRGGSNFATVTTTAANGGTLSAAQLVSAPDWVKLLGTTLTATVESDANLAATDYTATVSVVETYTETDTAGHSSQKTATGEASITITVANVADDSGTNTDGSAYDTSVSSQELDAMASLLGDGASVQALPDTVTVTANPNSASTMTFSDTTTKGVVSLPIMEDVPAGTYSIKVTLPASVPTITSLPDLYPNGPDGGSVTVKFFVSNNGSLVAATTSDFVGGAELYVVFTVGASGNFEDASAEASDVEAAASLTNPVLAAKVSGSSGGPGKSGGGCDAGFTALALAVLGGFIASRRK